jgi:hypothetical protein
VCRYSDLLKVQMWIKGPPKCGEASYWPQYHYKPSNCLPLCLNLFYLNKSRLVQISQLKGTGATVVQIEGQAAAGPAASCGILLCSLRICAWWWRHGPQGADNWRARRNGARWWRRGRWCRLVWVALRYSSTSGVSTFLNIFIDARLDVWIDTCHFHGLLVLCLYIHTFMKKFSFMHVIWITIFLSFLFHPVQSEKIYSCASNEKCLNLVI